jgi:hypothetical protein
MKKKYEVSHDKIILSEDESLIRAIRGAEPGRCGVMMVDGDLDLPPGIYYPIMSEQYGKFAVPFGSVMYGKRLCISGSRDFNDWELVDDFVRLLPQETILVLGGARGVDREAEKSANHYRIHTEIHPADWSKGKSAGVIRNIEMIDIADNVVAFWDGKSRGTKHAIDYAYGENKLLCVIPPRKEWQEFNSERGRLDDEQPWLDMNSPVFSVKGDGDDN